MPVLTQKMIFRSDLKSNPNVLYIFGDNLARVGFGGQAKEMRGQPNAVGLPTKRSPEQFFTDDDLEELQKVNVDIFELLEDFLLKGGIIVIPEDGIGTGLSELPQRAPEILKYYEEKFALLKCMA